MNGVGEKRANLSKFAKQTLHVKIKKKKLFSD